MWHSALSVAGLVFFLLFAGFAAVYLPIRASGQRVRARRRLHPAGYTGGEGGSPLLRDTTEVRGLPAKLIDWQARRMRAGRATVVKPAELRTAISRTGLSEVEAYAVLRVVQAAATAIGAVIGFTLAGIFALPPLVPASFFAILGYVIPIYVTRKIVTRRKNRIYRELPSALDLLIVSLEAGLGIAEAIRFVGRESQRQGRVLGQELSTVTAEMSAGISLSASLHNLEERTGVEEIKSLVSLLVQSDKVGGRLAPALRASAELLRTKRRMRAEESAHRNAIKMLIPLVLLMLPAMMIVIAGPAMLQIFEVLGKGQ